MVGWQKALFAALQVGQGVRESLTEESVVRLVVCPMRILHLTLAFHRGGRRTAIERLAAGLAELGMKSELACLDEIGCPVEEIEQLFGVVKVAGRSRGLRPRSIELLQKFCRERQIDVVHAHDAASQFAGALLRRRLSRLRLLMTFHRSLPIESVRLRDRLRNAYATAKSQAVIVGSQERRRHFLDANYVPARKVVRIPFGVDVARFEPCPATREAVRQELRLQPGSVAFAAVGHFGGEKGIDQIVTAFRLMREKRPGLPVELIVCGTGSADQHGRLEQLAGADARVRFLGFRQDVPRLLQGADVLVHAPRMEAFGLVLIEGMASGLPVVATSVGGITDIVVDRETGLLVPSNHPGALTGALEKLADDGILRREMGAAGRERAIDEYTIRLYAERHRRLYEDLLQRRPPRGVDEESVKLAP